MITLDSVPRYPITNNNVIYILEQSPMKTIIDYLFFRYYMVCIKREESPRFGATCILAEIVTMAYLFAVLILSFFLTGDFFLPNTSGEERIVIGVIGCFLPYTYIIAKKGLRLCWKNTKTMFITPNIRTRPY